MSNQLTSPLSDVLADPPAPSIGTGSVDKVLHAVRTHLGMDVAFVSQFRTTDRVFRHVDARDRSPIHPGDVAPLESGYCQRVVDGRLPQLIPDAHALPACVALPETAAIPIGSHLSVPIRLADGRVYGTFCCFSFIADPSLGQRDLQMMKAFADLVADQLDRDLEQARTFDEKKKRITDVIAGDQPSIVYQPIYDLQTNRLVGAESLSRFTSDPPRSPDKWFADAGQVALRTELELRAIEKALANLHALPETLYVAVNASPETASHPAFATLLTHFDPRRVVIEITEHHHIADYTQLLESLAPLRALGLRVAIDDAGAGYASMRHVLNVQPDLIKLDMSLTQNIDRDSKRRALASALIAFARETDATIVAEGVETVAELETLKALGATRAQGYLLGRPMPLNSLVPVCGERLSLAAAQSSTADCSAGRLVRRV